MVFNKSQKGFTIIELTIATVVFSVVMMGVTSAVIFIGKQYTQAQNRTILIDATRDIFQEITSSIHTANVPIKDLSQPTWNAFCAGEKKYIYGKYTQAGYDTMNKGLYVSDFDGTNCNANSPTSSDPQVLPDNARVLSLDYTGNQITIISTTADEDLLDFGASGLATEVKCDNTLAGKEFCALIKFSGSSVPRITGG